MDSLSHPSHSWICVRQELGDQLMPSDIGSLKLPHLLDLNMTGKSYMSILNAAVAYFFDSRWLLCQQECKVLLDITWEHLNTGHWKDVDLTWRHAYSIVSLLNTVSGFAVLPAIAGVDKIIRSCDMGLLMGAPVLSNILARLADRLQQIHNDRHVAYCSKPTEEITLDKAQWTELDCGSTELTVDMDMLVGDRIIVEHCPSLERFSTMYMSTGTPVILRGCIENWPAMSHNRWSPQYMKKVAGCRLVPVEIGSKYTDDSWSQTLITVDEFFDGITNRNTASQSLAYLAQHQLFDQIPRLHSDIIVPDYCALSNDEDGCPVDINAWFGPKATISPLHQDAKHNMLAQVVGRKYLRLFHPSLTNHLYPHSSQLLSTTSRVDVDHPDLEQFPLLQGLTFTDCILQEGDLLYLPPMYWHYVRSLSVSFSVSFWWQ